MELAISEWPCGWRGVILQESLGCVCVLRAVSHIRDVHPPCIYTHSVRLWRKTPLTNLSTVNKSTQHTALYIQLRSAPTKSKNPKRLWPPPQLYGFFARKLFRALSQSQKMPWVRVERKKCSSVLVGSWHSGGGGGARRRNTFSSAHLIWRWGATGGEMYRSSDLLSGQRSFCTKENVLLFAIAGSAHIPSSAWVN